MTSTSVIQLSNYELESIIGGDATSVAAVGVGGTIATIGANAMVGAAAIISAPFIGGAICVVGGLALAGWAVWNAWQ